MAALAFTLQGLLKGGLKTDISVLFTRTNTLKHVQSISTLRVAH